LIENEVPSGPVRDILEVLTDQELAKRGTIVDLIHPDAGKVGDFKTWGFPIKFSEAATGFNAPAPKLGANNEEIYRRFLGLTLDQLAVLKAEKVI